MRAGGPKGAIEMDRYGVIMAARDAVKILEVCPSMEAVRAARDRQRAAHRGEDCHIAAIYGEFGGQRSPERYRFRVIG